MLFSQPLVVCGTSKIYEHVRLFAPRLHYPPPARLCPLLAATESLGETPTVARLVLFFLLFLLFLPFLPNSVLHFVTFLRLLFLCCHDSAVCLGVLSVLEGLGLGRSRGHGSP